MAGPGRRSGQPRLGEWALFPNEDAVYINCNGHLPADKCHTATYQVPENNFLMRVYRPGQSVLNGSYKLPDAVACQ